jgi:hypothetical protein
LQALPNTWIPKPSLRDVMAARGHPSSFGPLACFGDRRLGPYEVLLARHRPEGDRHAVDYLLLRPATVEAAAALPPAPSAAELAAAAGAAMAKLPRPGSKRACAPAMDESEKEEEEGPPAPAPAPRLPHSTTARRPSSRRRWRRCRRRTRAT